MKKICREIRLRKFKSKLIETDLVKQFENQQFHVLYNDGTWETCCCKEELYDIIAKDHIKKIHYIYDMVDRIILSRDVIIDLEELK